MEAVDPTVFRLAIFVLAISPKSRVPSGPEVKLVM